MRLYPFKRIIRVNFVSTDDYLLDKTELPSELFKRWVYSSEKKVDNEWITMYVPEGTAHSARRRQGFEISRDGKFIIHDVGPTDRPREIRGFYEVIGQGKLKVHVDAQGLHDFTLNIISLQQGVLSVKTS